MVDSYLRIDTAIAVHRIYSELVLRSVLYDMYRVFWRELFVLSVIYGS